MLSFGWLKFSRRIDRSSHMILDFKVPSLYLLLAEVVQLFGGFTTHGDRVCSAVEVLVKRGTIVYRCYN